MNLLYLLDTNTVLDMMRNPQGPATQRAVAISQSTPEAQFQTSIIVDCERLCGLARKPQARLQAVYERTMATLTALPLGNDVAQTYASMRNAVASICQGLDANDTLIAAHALTVGATLVSADAAFTRIPDLKLENWLL